MICNLCNRMSDNAREFRAYSSQDWTLQVCTDAKGCQNRMARARYFEKFDAKSLFERAAVVRTLGGTNLDDHVRRVDPSITRGGRETDAEFRERAARLIDPAFHGDRAKRPAPQLHYAVTVGSLPPGAKFMHKGRWYEVSHDQIGCRLLHQTRISTTRPSGGVCGALANDTLVYPIVD